MRTTLLTKLHLEPALHPQLNSCCRMIYLLELLALVVQTYLLRLLVEKTALKCCCRSVIMKHNCISHCLRASLGFKQGQGRLKTALATQQDMPRHSDEYGSVALYLFMNVNFDWHVLAHRRCSGFLATPAGSIVPADLVYRHGGNWQEDAAKNAALRELRRRGWVASGLQRRGPLFHAGKRHDADKPEISGQVWESAWGWGV